MQRRRQVLIERVRDARGSVLPWFAIWLPVLVLFAALAIDVANWFEHRRHLQTQADAAVLAGGSTWGAANCTAGSITEQRIEAVARDYGGPHVGHTTPSTYNVAIYNPQVGGTSASNMNLLINSALYYNEGGTDHSDPNGSPCVSGYLDIKLTESNLPFFFPFAGSVVPAINAHARVRILEAAAVGGPQLLPVFVRDVNPVSAAALFVRDNADGTKTLLDAQFMTRASGCSSGLTCWSNEASPADVTIAPHTSVAVVVSNFPRCPAGGGNCLSLSGSVDTICGQFAAECYWGDSATGALRAGIVNIRGYDTAGGGGPPNAPVLRNVELVGAGGVAGATCADGYFSVPTTDCSVGIRAEVDMGTHPPDDARIRAFGGSCGNNGCTLTYNAGFWEGAIPIDNTPPPDPPTIPITLEWALRNTTIGTTACPTNFPNNSPCKAFFESGAYVQRAFMGSDPFSGPVRAARVFDTAAPSLDANSYPIGPTQRLYLTIQLAGSVATSASDPPVQLRAVDTSQSGIDCEPNRNYREELTLGCTGPFTDNPRLTAPDPCNPPYGTTQADLFNGPKPYDCVPVGPGASVGQFTDGIQGRILNDRQVCTSCPNTCPVNTGSFTPGRNYWSSMYGGWEPGDPRIVVVFMVPFGAFRAQGRALYPITNFGAFYVTGWGGNGGGNNDPCPGADSNVPTGWLSGHFIKYTLPSNSGGGTGPCTAATTNPCVAVLTE